jgi:alpha-glucosidase
MNDNNRIPEAHRWPEGAIVYHIYPRSLQDSNDDGIGDLKGIIRRLDYLSELSVTAIWLSPFYPSPMADFGYDIADYCNVDPIFGSLSDFDELVAEAHARDIKVIIDLVPNHTSDDHAWFKESRQSADSPKADWYIWRDGRRNEKGDAVLLPNNWRDALTGGPAWEWDEGRKQFYLHSFDVRQPDLNWSNSAVREAMKEVMRFWLNRAVDGFRVDAVYWMGKEPLLHDDSTNPHYVEGEDLLYNAVLHNNSRGWPAVYAYLSEMASVLKEESYHASPRFMVTEAYPERHNPIADYMAFYVGVDPEVAAPFNFEGVSLPWKAADWRRFLKSFHAALRQFSPHCVASYAFGNHDQPRLASRIGSDAARSAAIMLFTLPGMAFIYYGEEIGMVDAEVPFELVQDPAAKGDPKHGRGRDPERTPMQWSADTYAGFSAHTPWLPVSDDYTVRNVDTQSKDPNSYLSLYRQLGRLRSKTPALQNGHIEVLDIAHDNIMGYICSHEQNATERFLVLINFSETPASCEIDMSEAQLIVSSDPQTTLAAATDDRAELRPHEGALFSLASK